jgi:hypothetical protein
MRWGDERYVRVYTRDTPEWCVLSWEARGVFMLLLRAVDRAGILKLGRGGHNGLATLLRVPVEVIERVVPELCEDGCVEFFGTMISVPNFIQAQEAPASDAVRKRAERERAAAGAKGKKSAKDNTSDLPFDSEPSSHAASRDVTSAHTVVTGRGSVSVDPAERASNVQETSTITSDVTSGHAESHAVTPCHSVLIRSVPNRAEPNRPESDQTRGPAVASVVQPQAPAPSVQPTEREPMNDHARKILAMLQGHPELALIATTGVAEALSTPVCNLTQITMVDVTTGLRELAERVVKDARVGTAWDQRSLNGAVDGFVRRASEKRRNGVATHRPGSQVASPVQARPGAANDWSTPDPEMADLTPEQLTAFAERAALTIQALANTPAPTSRPTLRAT